MKTSPAITARSSIGDSFRHILLQELKPIKKWRKVAIKGSDPEGVHQIRVSLRKMRTALVTFKPLINTKFSRRLAKDIRKFAKILDNARDLDVYILTNFPQANTQSLLQHSATEQRELAYKKVRKLLKGKTFNNCICKCKKWLKQSQWSKQLSMPDQEATNLPISPLAALILDKLMSEIIIKAKQLESLDDIELHQFRILCKKLRYSTEFFASLYDDESVNIFIEQLKQVQDRLGDIHDCVVAKQLHQELLPSTDASEEKLKELQQIEVNKVQFSLAMKVKLQQDLVAFCQYVSPWENDLNKIDDIQKLQRFLT